MTHFVFVHGAWHRGWSFDALRPLLAEQGHSMSAPDLPGMGGSDAELGAVTLAGWADYIAGICKQAGESVILAGHSRGGIVISEVAERIPDQITSLVYICAMLLPSEMSREMLKSLVPPNPNFQAIIRPDTSGFATLVDPIRAPSIFAQLSLPEAARAAAARLVAEPSAPRLTPLSLTQARYGSVPRHYIECVHDLTIPIGDQRAMQTLQPCATVTSLEADHSPFLSTPQALADALHAIAQSHLG
jgi:pimeloyl-ACP methyl ester carboxylesterase